MTPDELRLWKRIMRTHGRPGNVWVVPETGEGMSKEDRDALCALLRKFPVWEKMNEQEILSWMTTLW